MANERRFCEEFKPFKGVRDVEISVKVTLADFHCPRPDMPSECERFYFLPHVSISEQKGDAPARPPWNVHTSRMLHPIAGTEFLIMDMTNTQVAVCKINPRNSRGGPAKLDGVPQWNTDASDIVELTPDPDGLSCSIRAVGMVGTANVQVTGDADLGAGVSPIIGTGVVNVTPGAATTIDLTFDPPAEQP